MKKVISAIVMLIVIIPIVWYGGNFFKVGVCVVGLLALKEILDLRVSHKEYPMLVKLISMIVMILIILAEYDGYSIMFGVTYRGIAILLLSLLSLSVIYKDYDMKDAIFLIGAVLLIGVSFNAMILVRMFGVYKFMFLILIFILTDTFALVGGKLFGKHKLIERVSPNKTIEGSIIGSLVGTLGASIFYHYLVNPISVKVVLGILLLSIIGQLGDLIFSKIKRENGIKDFSNIIPGHGGILDRLDSTIAIMLGYLIFYGLF